MNIPRTVTVRLRETKKKKMSTQTSQKPVCVGNASQRCTDPSKARQVAGLTEEADGARSAKDCCGKTDEDRRCEDEEREAAGVQGGSRFYGWDEKQEQTHMKDNTGRMLNVI